VASAVNGHLPSKGRLFLLFLLVLFWVRTSVFM